MPEVEEPPARETRMAIHLDQDRKGISGSPDLARVIFEKIQAAAVFIADVTSVGFVPNETEDPAKKLINPNVAIELGYALHALPDRALLMVMNEHYGDRSDLPLFAVQSRSDQILSDPDCRQASIEAASRQLTAEFREALKPFIAKQAELIRQKNPFPAAEAKDGPARFRSPGEPVGRLCHPFGAIGKRDVTLRPGPATWLRLMPLSRQAQTWTTQELWQASQAGGVHLQPFIWSDYRAVRAQDGIGAFNSFGNSEETDSLAFAFETGEVWAVDCWALGVRASEICIGEIERGWCERLPDYASFLTNLTIAPPYRWIAGLAGVSNWRLQYPPMPGLMRHFGGLGPECLADQIVAEGTYTGSETPQATLLPFFEAIYAKCGMRRPSVNAQGR